MEYWSPRRETRNRRDKPTMADGQRIQMLDVDEARRRATERGIPETMAELSVFRIALHQPGVAVGLNTMLHELLWKGVLDARLRELIIMRIGWATGSVYEWTQHWRVARLLDIPERDLLGVRNWEDDDQFGNFAPEFLFDLGQALLLGRIGRDHFVAQVFDLF